MSDCGCGSVTPDREALLDELSEGESLVTVKYVGASRANLRGALTRRSYGKVEKNDVVQILDVDFKYRPRLFEEVG